MILRWLRGLRHASTLRAARELLAWHVRAVWLVEVCQDSLRPHEMPSDPAAELLRVDWALEYMWAHARTALPRLRRDDRQLAERLERATDQAVVLRNQLVSFFIRWESHREADREDSPGAFLLRRDWEDALLDARRTARGLSAELDELRPAFDDLSRRWTGGPPHTPHKGPAIPAS